MYHHFVQKHLQAYLTMQKQVELLEDISQLPEVEQKKFLEQLSKLIKFFPNKIPPVDTSSFYSKQLLKPFTTPKHLSKKSFQIGLDALNQSSVATIILAGGDGSRLNYDKPKGCFPISPIKKKSLFELHFEKIKFLQKHIEKPLQICVLSSEKNKDITLKFLQDHKYFDINPHLIHILEQPSIPLINEKNKWFFETSDKIATGPNGNGGFISALFKSDVVQQLESLGCLYFMMISIDNPLADPFDIHLIGQHISHQNDMSFYCYKRDCPQERTGILSYYQDQFIIVDYNNFDEQTYSLKNKTGFSFPYANTNIFCLSLDFLKTIYQKDLLPIHWIKKLASQYNFSTHDYKTITAWKGEKFITDLLQFTTKIEAIEIDKALVFAPLKSLYGVNDVNSVHQAIFNKNQSIYKKLTGSKTFENFELSMEYYSPFGNPTSLLGASCLEGKYYD